MPVYCEGWFCRFELVGSIMWLLYFHEVFLPVLVHGHTGVRCPILNLFSLKTLKCS